MKKRKTDWIHIQTPENKNMIGSPSYIRKLLGLDSLQGQIRAVWRQIDKIQEAIVENVLIPEMEDKILSIIRENPEIKTRDLNDNMPWKDMERTAWYDAFDKLKDEGRIIGTSHGRGHNRTWRVKQEVP